MRCHAQGVTSGSAFEKLKLDSPLRLRCSTAKRAIYAVAPSRSPLQPTTIFGDRKRIPHYLLNFASTTNQRDSGFCGEGNSKHAEVQEVQDARLRAILASKEVWMGGERVVAVDEEGLRLYGVEL